MQKYVIIYGCTPDTQGYAPTRESKGMRRILSALAVMVTCAALLTGCGTLFGGSTTSATVDAERDNGTSITYQISTTDTAGGQVWAYSQRGNDYNRLRQLNTSGESGVLTITKGTQAVIFFIPNSAKQQAGKTVSFKGTPPSGWKKLLTLPR